MSLGLQTKGAGSVCLLFWLLLMTLFSSIAAAGPVKGQEVAVRVNGKAFPADEVAWQWQRYLRKSGAQGMRTDDTSALQTEFLESLIRQELAAQAATAAGFSVDLPAVEGEIAALRSRFSDEAAFSAELARQGLSPELLRKQTEKSHLVRRWAEQTFVVGQTVSEDEASAWYQQNAADRLQSPERVCARHLLITFDPQGIGTTKTQALHRAEAMRQRWLAGESFSALCRQFSECPSTEQEGDLGCFSREEMLAEFADAAFALAPWDVSQVVETSKGLHLIQVYQRQSADVPTYAEAREAILGILRVDKSKPQIEAFLNRQRKKAVVEVLAAP